LSTSPDLTSAIVIHPARAGEARARTAQASLEEISGLAAAIDLKVARAAVAPVGRPSPATFLGAGKVEEIRVDLDARDPRPGLVIIDHALSPVQHRNLEKALDAKVLDRTALILEIFGERARTSEGRLQVELAHLTYQKSRLVRSWTHLERQRGGRGFLGGPGERQIESDRRALADRIDRLKEKLEGVERTRALQRAKRKRAPYPVVALVGYTNAGKSTLFNRLTRSQIDARDLLFATLDPTMRAADLASGQRIIVSDTVGFVSNLPTHLVAAFGATLEEVVEADLVIHVRDAAHPDSEAQRDDVIAVLESLGLAANDERLAIEALNKVDLISEDERARADAAADASRLRSVFTLQDPAKIVLSAATGDGVGDLEALVDRLLTQERRSYVIEVPLAEGKGRAFLHQSGDVTDERIDGDCARLTVRLSEKSLGQFQKAFPAVRIEEPRDAARRIA
jgi:GTP-binding protein HflX